MPMKPIAKAAGTLLAKNAPVNNVSIPMIALIKSPIIISPPYLVPHDEENPILLNAERPSL